jgi:hypothetical protein
MPINLTVYQHNNPTFLKRFGNWLKDRFGESSAEGIKDPIDDLVTRFEVKQAGVTIAELETQVEYPMEEWDDQNINIRLAILKKPGELINGNTKARDFAREFCAHLVKEEDKQGWGIRGPEDSSAIATKVPYTKEEMKAQEERIILIRAHNIYGGTQIEEPKIYNERVIENPRHWALIKMDAFEWPSFWDGSHFFSDYQEQLLAPLPPIPTPAAEPSTVSEVEVKQEEPKHTLVQEENNIPLDRYNPRGLVREYERIRKETKRPQHTVFREMGIGIKEGMPGERTMQHHIATLGTNPQKRNRVKKEKKGKPIVAPLTQ